MEGLWEKISSYNIFNNLFPGALFVYLFERASHVVLSTEDIVKNVVLYYFLGLVLGRLGSIVIEPLFRLFRLVKFAPYDKFVAASKIDSKIDILQEVANMYRTLFTVSVIMLLSLYFMSKVNGENYILSQMACSLFALLFLISYVKQIRYIVRRVIKITELP
ncbi:MULTISPECIES: phosphohistidine phosphatase [Enterobacter cloacae complex]|uniref:phosphohistidine phosphatase n=1 Tax=Enterobacter cloacae complex TaxID=354276 RepID=UPI0018667227|nr:MULTISPECIES: phosphohistidine phosphatase [Enterobacter cloacae complex]EJB6972293.1 phosphohistidine phosphatase [Enterobacter hormaechei]EKT5037287.1 phosphohistidine phosphatase [Enterobacter hormaechei]EMB8501970.1 phosphohistidine phosphatase [Enterobacter hormaechei]MBW7589847.1 phosphohistidine phosphatase [Enterobacter kobei]